MKIGIVSSEKAKELAGEITQYLERKNIEVVDSAKSHLEVDVVLVLGGDGTLLHAACEFIELAVPFFGINVGTLGFLTSEEGKDWQVAVDKIIAGDYFVSERMTIEADHFRALNEIVVKGMYRVVDIELIVNGDKFMEIVGDGVIIATQTGSTAYSLSAGGPIVDPEVDCILITPVNAHGLPVPSVVLSPEDEIEIKINKGDDISLIIDGGEHTKLGQNQSVKVKRGEYRVKLGYFDKHQFFKTLNSKFGLNNRSSQG